MKRFLILFLLLSSGILSNPQVSFILGAESFQEDLSPYIMIFEDKTKILEFKDIKNQQFSKLGQSNMGYSDSVFWLKWEVNNSNSIDRKIFIVFESTVIDSLTLYSSSYPNFIQESGDSHPFLNRSINYRYPNFQVSIPSKSEETLYLKITSQSTIPIQLYMYSLDNLSESIAQEQLLYGIYYGWMIVMVLYNLFLYLSARYESYLYYVLFILSLTVFEFILNGFGFQYFWSNLPPANNVLLLIFMILSNLSGLLFSAHYLKTKEILHWLYRIYQVMWILGGLLIGSIFIFDYSLNIKLATLYSGASAIVLIVNGLLSYTRKVRTAKIFLIANSIFVLGVLFYTAKSLGIVPSNLITNWTIQIGSAIQVALLSLGLADRIKELSKDLNLRLFELDETSKKLTSSENRFKQLFNGINDMIFLLDDDWNFIDVNRSINHHLGFKPEEIIGKNILEIIYKTNDKDDSYNRIYIMEKLEELFDTKSPVNFYAEFNQKFVIEPRELHIKLQYIQLEDRLEIMGSGSLVIEDILGRYLKNERITFEVENYLRNAELMSSKLTQHLNKFTDNGTVLGVRTCLREIIINAIEHGNLNISYEEKTKSMEDGSYFQFIQKRQLDPKYRDRVVTIDYVLDSKKIAYRITDQGMGFDHKKTMEKKANQLNEDYSQHGRGILMSKDIFDIVDYNDKGNQVNLVKYFKK